MIRGWDLAMLDMKEGRSPTFGSSSQHRTKMTTRKNIMIVMRMVSTIMTVIMISMISKEEANEG